MQENKGSLSLLFRSQCTTAIAAAAINGHIKTAEQRTIMQQYRDWYTGR